MKRSWILLALLALATGPLHAGVVYEIEVKDHEQSPPKSESIQAAVEGRHLKMGIASRAGKKGGEMIYRGDRRELVVVDHENQAYFVIDEESAARIAGQVGQAMSQVQEMLKDVPEDKRAMIEQMMKQKMPGGPPAEGPKVEVRRTVEKAEKNGYPCVRYELWRGGNRFRELWVTDWDNIEGGEMVRDAFLGMADLFGGIMDSFSEAAGGLPIGRDLEDAAWAHMKEIGGFPVITRDFEDDGSLENESGLRSAKRQTLDPDAFEPPSGYKRQEMFPGS